MGVDVVDVPDSQFKAHSYAHMLELRQKGINDNTTVVTFTVKFYYTPEVAAAVDDLELLFEKVSFF